MLPDLFGVRNPSNDLILKSAVAYILTLSRVRRFALRTLRGLQSESDSLRREVNEWRARAGVAPSLEPSRDQTFMRVLAGEEPDLVGTSDDEHVDPLKPLTPQMLKSWGCTPSSHSGSDSEYLTGQAAASDSSLNSFSEAESEGSAEFFLASSAREGWNRPTSNLTHRLMLQELSDDAG
ncbi:hypothetical protein K438DRAFT_1962392 [Mycena galopus ATCC 62051]|nr:hypothetical protein K438DRAFT_1962392 [Mycena galopus ATCC 62051]